MQETITRSVATRYDTSTRLFNLVQLRTNFGHFNRYRLLPLSVASTIVTMAGLEDASLTIQTLRPVDYFPANDVLHHYLPVPTSFTFASTCTDQWMIMDFITQTDLNNLFPTSCLPLGGPTAYYSPGTCVSGHHIAALTEFRTARWTTGGLRAWGAVCCREYVFVPSYRGAIPHRHQPSY